MFAIALSITPITGETIMSYTKHIMSKTLEENGKYPYVNLYMYATEYAETHDKKIAKILKEIRQKLKNSELDEGDVAALQQQRFLIIFKDLLFPGEYTDFRMSFLGDDGDEGYAINLLEKHVPLLDSICSGKEIEKLEEPEVKTRFFNKEPVEKTEEKEEKTEEKRDIKENEETEKNEEITKKTPTQK